MESGELESIYLFINKHKVRYSMKGYFRRIDVFFPREKVVKFAFMLLKRLKCHSNENPICNKCSNLILFKDLKVNALIRVSFLEIKIYRDN